MTGILVVGQNHHIRGGSDRYFLEMCDGLGKEGWDVVPFAAANPQNTPSPYENHFPPAADFDRPGPVDAMRYLFSPAARKACDQLLKSKQVSLAHLNIYYGKLTASILKPLKQRGVPIVQTLHEYKLICPVYTQVSNGAICERCSVGSYYRCAIGRCNRGSVVRSLLSTLESHVSHALGAVNHVDHFVAISEFSRRMHIAHGVAESRISAIPNFVLMDGVVPETTAGDYVLYFGRIERIKGVFTLLEAASRLPAIQFAIAGSGNAFDEFKTEIAQRGLTNVELLGHLSGDALDRCIRGALCTVLPAEWHEPFGLTILESFARGRCVVASRIGGIPEIIGHGEHGLLFSPGNAVELAEHLSWLAQNPVRAGELGLAGRRRAEEHYSWAAYYRQLRDVYRQLGVAVPPVPQ